MLAVAVGWQIYAMTGNALDLGLVGLVQFIPIVAMSLVIGQAADHFDRRAVARACQIVKALCASTLALGTAAGWLNREAIFAILFVIGTARAFETPTLHALLPGIVPPPLLPRAIAASATANQAATIGGPALGGLIYAFGPSTVYVTCTVVFLARQHSRKSGHSDTAPKRAQAGQLGVAACGLCLYPEPAGAARCHLARSVCGAAWRRHGTAADLRARYSANRSLGSRTPAFGARCRRARMSVVLAHYSIDRRVGRCVVRISRRVRCRDHRVCAVDLICCCRSRR